MAARRPLAHDVRIALTALVGTFPAVLAALLLVHLDDHTSKLRWTVDVFVLGGWLGTALVLRDRVARPLQTLANLIAGLREGDYSLRGRKGSPDDPVAQAYHELNLFADRLRDTRLGALEAAALLAQVMEEIDVAILAVDFRGELRFCNRAAESLLGAPSAQLVGRRLETLGPGLGELLSGEAPRTLAHPLAGRPGPWELRRREFRQQGVPHHLLVLTDLRRALREEERQAWQRLVRVLGHEINNSLAPIQSIASSLVELARAPKQEDFAEDLARGLEIIARRSEALGRFMQSYARLARLPPPRLKPLDVAGWLEKIAGLEKRKTVEVVPGPPVRVLGDEDQLDQLGINLLKNAVDAASETGGAVRVGWREVGREVEVWVEDEGPGIANPANLFVPFFTTKPGGSGIGLVLCRQIAEAHGGALSLENREGARGAIARLRLPRATGA